MTFLVNEPSEESHYQFYFVFFVCKIMKQKIFPFRVIYRTSIEVMRCDSLYSSDER